MSTIYLIKGSSGRYDMRVVWTVRAELTKGAAEQHVALCLQQLKEEFNEFDPPLAPAFPIPADPEARIAPFHAGASPRNWWIHGIVYEIEEVQLNNGITEQVVLHRCGLPT